jgi:5-methylthioribose kinase
MTEHRFDPLIHEFVMNEGLVETEAYSASPLTGGVASDIWLIQSGSLAFVVKKALAQLRVAQEWRAPVSRNASEVEWMLEAARVVPASVPRILAHDADRGIFAMSYLEPDRHPIWKAELMVGRVDSDFAALIGRQVARIHAATAGRADIVTKFDNDATFHALRLEPYLEATARAHPDLADALFGLSHTVSATKKALVHGDISPKNLLVGPDGPVILDAECAWYGDPSFDMAFCLNHLILKSVHLPRFKPAFIGAFDAMSAAYLEAVDWEPRADIEARIAALLPALTLARIDGKSPVEYLTRDQDKRHVRAFAARLVERPARSLDEIVEHWKKELTDHD